MRRLILALAVPALIGLGCSSGGGGDSGSSASGGSSGGSVGGTTGGSGGGGVSAGIGIPEGLLASSCGTPPPDPQTFQLLSDLFHQYLAGKGNPLSSPLLKSKTVDIPVVFHIISTGPSEAEGEIPDASLNEQISVMNRGYSGEIGGVATPFQFHLAAVDRQRKPEWAMVPPGSQTETDMKTALRQGGPETLNIYFTTIGDNILGYSTFPILYSFLPKADGIVLDFRAVVGGPLDHYNLGHVAIHETGHWLGLLHTFQGECDGLIDDLVSDTPREMTPGHGMFCPADLDSCPSDPGPDPIHNHMTYTDDGCRTEFTAGQLQLMEFNALAFRAFQIN